jgi:phosphoribosyl 1,2-cyclic phosphodiesterase
MKVTLWGTRGSVARSGPDTVRYGGDTSSVEVVGDDGTWLILDAGSGLLRVNPRLPGNLKRIDLLLTHLHMDHIQGLGFFHPLFDPDIEVHLWGPGSITQNLGERLTRYLSPPLFPVRLRDLRALALHGVGPESFEIGPFTVTADLVCHPGPTLGYRIAEAGRTLVYLPDHEPALGYDSFPGPKRWTSGFDLVRDADVVIHDAQYTDAEYEERVGWGHSTPDHARALATLAGVGILVPFHHDPEHTDEELDDLLGDGSGRDGSVEIVPGKAGTVIDL